MDPHGLKPVPPPLEPDAKPRPPSSRAAQRSGRAPANQHRTPVPRLALDAAALGEGAQTARASCPHPPHHGDGAQSARGARDVHRPMPPRAGAHLPGPLQGARAPRPASGGCSFSSALNKAGPSHRTGWGAGPDGASLWTDSSAPARAPRVASASAIRPGSHGTAPSSRVSAPSSRVSSSRSRQPSGSITPRDGPNLGATVRTAAVVFPGQDEEEEARRLVAEAEEEAAAAAAEDAAFEELKAARDEAEGRRRARVVRGATDVADYREWEEQQEQSAQQEREKENISKHVQREIGAKLRSNNFYRMQKMNLAPNGASEKVSDIVAEFELEEEEIERLAQQRKISADREAELAGGSLGGGKAPTFPRSVYSDGYNPDAADKSEKQLLDRVVMQARVAQVRASRAKPHVGGKKKAWSSSVRTAGVGSEDAASEDAQHTAAYSDEHRRRIYSARSDRIKKQKAVLLQATNAGLYKRMTERMEQRTREHAKHSMVNAAMTSRHIENFQQRQNLAMKEAVMAARGQQRSKQHGAAKAQHLQQRRAKEAALRTGRWHREQQRVHQAQAACLQEERRYYGHLSAQAEKQEQKWADQAELEAARRGQLAESWQEQAQVHSKLWEGEETRDARMEAESGRARQEAIESERRGHRAREDARRAVEEKRKAALALKKRKEEEAKRKKENEVPAAEEAIKQTMQDLFKKKPRRVTALFAQVDQLTQDQLSSPSTSPNRARRASTMQRRQSLMTSMQMRRSKREEMMSSITEDPAAPSEAEEDSPKRRNSIFDMPDEDHTILQYVVSGSFNKDRNKKWNFFDPRSWDPEELEFDQGQVVHEFTKAYDLDRYSPLKGRKIKFQPPAHTVKMQQQRKKLAELPA